MPQYPRAHGVREAVAAPVAEVERLRALVGDRCVTWRCSECGIDRERGTKRRRKGDGLPTLLVYAPPAVFTHPTLAAERSRRAAPHRGTSGSRTPPSAASAPGAAAPARAR